MEIEALPPWLLAKLRAPLPNRAAPSDDPADMMIPSGGRNNILTSMAGTMRRRGFPESSILAALMDLNEKRCDPPMDPVEVRTIAWSIGRYRPGDDAIAAANLSAGDSTIDDEKPIEDWPGLPDAALRGVAGEIVRTLAPYTEADPAGVLLHFLTFFGNCVGAGPHFRVGGDEHTAKLFGVLVGDSSTGRKGTSEGDVRRIFETVDPDWSKKRIIHGLASGEGLIRCLTPESGFGAPDPRLMAIEREFGNVLRAIGREGSILSGILRKAWDSGDLQHQTRKNPIVVHGAHVSLIAHITKSELIRTMNAGESFNGFANRFLWIVVRRSKSLPDAPQVPDRIFQALAHNVAEAVDTARRTGEMRRNADATLLWRDLYEELQKPRPGILGALTSRGHVQVLRLAAIYALLDSSPEVAVWHIEAAKAFWDYSVDCAARIFGSRMGDVIAQRMLDELRESEGSRMTRTELWESVGRNVNASVFENALQLLSESGYVTRSRAVRKPGERGRRLEIVQIRETRAN